MIVSEDSDMPLILPEIDFGTPAPAVAVALSGGPDSMALCFLLSQWAGKNGTRIHALTVDHGLRPEAAAEAAQVGRWVKNWPCIKHHILHLSQDVIPAKAGIHLTACVESEMDPGSRPAAQGLSGMTTRIMERARNGRYAALTDYCREHTIEKLFVAHHRDDQAETFLFRLAKGSGLDGLAAMRRESAKDGILIVRPFLDIPKARLIATCHAHKIPFVEDPTNDDARYARPRLRQSYDVLAAEGLTPKRLAVTAARLARAKEALDHYAAAAFQKNIKEENRSKIILDYAELKNEPAETRLRVLLLAMEKLTPDEDGYGPRREKAEELVESLFSDMPFRKQTLGGCIFSRDGNITIEKECP